MKNYGVYLAAIVIFSSGCASQSAARQDEYADPLEPINRGIYVFNDIADKYVLRPVAKGYVWLLPSLIRTGVNNFYDNLGSPVDIVNAFLQGKIKQGFSDTGRFALNSTFGLLGILDPASDVGLMLHDEDFGQTMGVWGIPEGPYLVIPFFGPRTARSGIGNLGDALIHPQVQMSNSSLRSKINILYFVHTRSTLLGIDSELDRAFDRYTFIKDAYLQNRRYLVLDGNLPEDDFYLEDEEFDDYDDF
jgi:phospholipid-binding lipoprotein MlaA